MMVKVYDRKPLQVQAIKFTRDDFDAVDEFQIYKADTFEENFEEVHK